MIEKLTLVALLILFAGCGCTSTHNSPPQVDSKAPALVLDNLKTNGSKIRVEFVLSWQDKIAYPEAFEAFVLALKEWASLAPVEFMVFIPNPDMFATVGSIALGRPGILILDFVDNIKAPVDSNFLGTFSWSTRTLRLDMGDFYNPEFRPDMAKVVALHELGHVFGLTHFYNSGDVAAPAGSFIVTSGAEKMVMAPHIARDHADLHISELELERAINYISSVLPTKLDRF